MKKYELTDEMKQRGSILLRRIRALRDIEGVCKKGDLGGFVESERNLSQGVNDSWVSDDALVFGDAHVSDCAQVSGNALVFGNAWVSGNARVSGNALVSGNAWVSGNALVSGDAWVSGNALVFGNALVSGNARVSGDAQIAGSSRVSGDSRIFGDEGGKQMKRKCLHCGRIVGEHPRRLYCARKACQSVRNKIKIARYRERSRHGKTRA